MLLAHCDFAKTYLFDHGTSLSDNVVLTLFLTLKLSPNPTHNLFTYHFTLILGIITLMYNHLTLVVSLNLT